MNKFTSPSSFQIMTKPRGAICNLACEYCYFLKKEWLYPKSDFRMSDLVLESYTQQYIQAQRGPRVTFAWQGGEPTLIGLKFYKQAVAFQEQYAHSEMKIENALQTNGTLLDASWCQFFKENNFLIGISIDGPQRLHNACRKNKGGAGSFDEVMRGLEFLQKYDVKFNILTTIHAANADYPTEVYHFIRDELEAEFIQFIPIVERDNKKGEQRGNKVTDRSVTAKQYGDFLIEIFDEWVRRDVGDVFVQIFDVALGKWLDQPGGLCVFEETCGLSLVMEHNGDLYSCDHFVEQRYKLGNIIHTDLIQLAGSHKQYQFGLDKKEALPGYCLDCEVRFACNGGCPKNRIRHTPDGDYGLNYLCQGYQAFFKHIDMPMQRMAKLIRNRRPPSEIKGEVRNAGR